MGRCEIRPMLSGELERVVSMWRRSREDAQPWLEARMGHSHEDDLRYLGDVVLRESQVWVALLDGEPVGMLAIRDDLVGQLYVEPAVQGRGIGSALLDLAKSLSPDGLSLFTHQRNERARAFYERRGFRAVAFGVSPPPENEPDIRYAWSP